MMIINAQEKSIPSSNTSTSRMYLIACNVSVTVANSVAGTTIISVAFFARCGFMLKECGRLTAIRRSMDTSTSRNIEKVAAILMIKKNTTSFTKSSAANVKTIPEMQTAESAMASANMYTLVDVVILNI